MSRIASALTLTSVLASLPLASLGGAPEGNQAVPGPPETGSIVEMVTLNQPTDPLLALNALEDNDQTLAILEYEIGTTTGFYVVDNRLTAEENLELLTGFTQSEVKADPVISGARLVSSNDESAPGIQHKRQVSSSLLKKAAAGLQRELENLPAVKPSDPDLDHWEANNSESNSLETSDTLSAGVSAAKYSEPHAVKEKWAPNLAVTTMQQSSSLTTKNINSNAHWYGNSSPRKMPASWAFEMATYQVNPFVGDGSRPFCAKNVDDAFWASPDIKGRAMIFVINGGDTNAAVAEPYVDWEHATDPCAQAAIGFGVGKPQKIPDMKRATGTSRGTLHATIYASINAKAGTATRTPGVWGTTKAVFNTCLGVTDSWCTGLGGVFPSGSGRSYHYTLSPNRGWVGPASWQLDLFTSSAPVRF